MIIGNTFDPEKANTSRDYAYKCWYNKKFEGNTLHITNQELQVIETKWSAQLSNWKLQADSIDQNGYDIEDFEGEEFDAGKKEAQETAGHDGKMGKSAANNAGNIVGAVGSTAVGATALAGGISGTTSILGQNVSTAWVVSCPIAFAIGLIYELTKPNKKEHDALMQLKALMESGGQNMVSSQNSMEFIEGDIVAEIEKSEDNKATTEEEIAELQELIRIATEMYNEIIARIENGEEVSESDKKKLPQISKNISALNARYETLVLDAATRSEEAEDNIDTKNEEYQESADVVEQEVGVTEFAAGFDKVTRDLCITQAVVQGLNVVTGTVGGIMATIQAWVTYGVSLIFAALGFAGAGMSAHGVVEQSKFAHDLNGELDIRANTEGIADDTWNTYEAKTSNSEMFLSSAGEVTDYFAGYKVPETELADIPTTPAETGKTDTPTVQAKEAQSSQTQDPNQKPKNPNDPKTA